MVLFQGRSAPAPECASQELALQFSLVLNEFAQMGESLEQLIL